MAWSKEADGGSTESEDGSGGRSRICDAAFSPRARWYFVRGQLEIPVVDTGLVFAWGVWVSVSEKSFRRMAELWETEGRESEPPCFGWLNTRLPLYPDTASLETNVHTRAVGLRPFVELERTDHPLAIEQREGMTLDRVRAIAAALLHLEG